MTTILSTRVLVLPTFSLLPDLCFGCGRYRFLLWKAIFPINPPAWFPMELRLCRRECVERHLPGADFREVPG